MIDTSPQRRAQQAESKHAADLRALRAAKEDDLNALDERHKVLKNAYNQERTSIKEDFAMKRVKNTAKIDRLKDQRTILKQRLQCMTDIEEIAIAENEFARITSELENLRTSRIKLERQEQDALSDAENRFENRCKDGQEERRAINKHYIDEADKLHEAYLQVVEENRQLRDAEEGGGES